MHKKILKKGLSLTVVIIFAMSNILWAANGNAAETILQHCLRPLSAVFDPAGIDGLKLAQSSYGKASSAGKAEILDKLPIVLDEKVKLKEAIEKRQEKSEIILVGGGSGTNLFAPIIKEMGQKCTRVLTSFDEGGRTGRIKAWFLEKRGQNFIAVGDITKVLVEQAEHSPAIQEIMDSKFDGKTVEDGFLSGVTGFIFKALKEKKYGTDKAEFEKFGKALTDKAKLVEKHLKSLGELKGYTPRHLIYVALILEYKQQGRTYGDAIKEATKEFLNLLGLKDEEAEAMLVSVSENPGSLQVTITNREKIIGQDKITEDELGLVQELSFTTGTRPDINPEFKEKLDNLKAGDVVAFGPGSFYTSIMADLLPHGVADAIKDAKKRGVVCIFMLNPIYCNETIAMKGYARGAYVYMIEQILFHLNKYRDKGDKLKLSDLFDFIVANDASRNDNGIIKLMTKEGSIAADPQFEKPDKIRLGAIGHDPQDQSLVHLEQYLYPQNLDSIVLITGNLMKEVSTKSGSAASFDPEKFKAIFKASPLVKAQLCVPEVVILSDIHSTADKTLALIDTFSKRYVFVNGDIADRGDEPWNVLRLIDDFNIGDHEMWAIGVAFGVDYLTTLWPRGLYRYPPAEKVLTKDPVKDRLGFVMNMTKLEAFARKHYDPEKVKESKKTFSGGPSNIEEKALFNIWIKVAIQTLKRLETVQSQREKAGNKNDSWLKPFNGVKETLNKIKDELLLDTKEADVLELTKEEKNVFAALKIEFSKRSPKEQDISFNKLIHHYIKRCTDGNGIYRIISALPNVPRPDTLQDVEFKVHGKFHKSLLMHAMPPMRDGYFVNLFGDYLETSYDFKKYMRSLNNNMKILAKRFARMLSGEIEPEQMLVESVVPADWDEWDSVCGTDNPELFLILIADGEYTPMFSRVQTRATTYYSKTPEPNNIAYNFLTRNYTADVKPLLSRLKKLDEKEKLTDKDEKEKEKINEKLKSYTMAEDESAIAQTKQACIELYGMKDTDFHEETINGKTYLYPENAESNAKMVKFITGALGVDSIIVGHLDRDKLGQPRGFANGLLYMIDSSSAEKAGKTGELAATETGGGVILTKDGPVIARVLLMSEILDGKVKGFMDEENKKHTKQLKRWKEKLFRHLNLKTMLYYKVKISFDELWKAPLLVRDLLQILHAITPSKNLPSTVNEEMLEAGNEQWEKFYNRILEKDKKKLISWIEGVREEVNEKLQTDYGNFDEEKRKALDELLGDNHIITGEYFTTSIAKFLVEWRFKALPQDEKVLSIALRLGQPPLRFSGPALIEDKYIKGELKILTSVEETLKERGAPKPSEVLAAEYIDSKPLCEELKSPMDALLHEAQELLDFLAKTPLEQEALPISESDVGKVNPVILALGSPSPAAFKKAAEDWVRYKNMGFGNVPVIASTGRGRGYKNFVLMTLEFLEQKNKAFYDQFRSAYPDEIKRAEQPDADAETLFYEYNYVVNYKVTLKELIEKKKMSPEDITTTFGPKPTLSPPPIEEYKAKKLTEAKVIAFIMKMYGVDGIITLEEVSNNTYVNIYESLNILEELENSYNKQNNALPLKIRIVAASFHRLRALVTAIGICKEGKKRPGDKRAKNHDDWLINAEDSENAQLSSMSEERLCAYAVQTIGDPFKPDEISEIERLASYGGQWLVHSAKVEQAVSDRGEWNNERVLNLRKKLLKEYIDAKKELDLLTSTKASSLGVPAIEGVVGLLFDPDYTISGKYSLLHNPKIETRRTPEKAIGLLESAEVPLEITAHLRGVDGPGSSLDLPEFQLRLYEDSATGLSQIPSTPTLASEFLVKIRFEKAGDPDSIEYIAPDYGITKDRPYSVKVTDENGRVIGIKLETVTTAEGRKEKRTPNRQKDAPAYIFANIFGLRGIRIICESISPMALAGGMESSNAFNVALYSAASMLSGANLSLADIFARSVIDECVAMPTQKESGMFGGLTGGQGHLASMLGGAYHHVWLSGKEDGVYGAFSRPFLSEKDFPFIEEHMALAQAGKKYKNGKAEEGRTAALINLMWTFLLRIQDAEAVKLHKEKLGLAAEYVKALQNHEMETAVKTVNRYVDIRDELCRIWAKRVLAGNTELLQRIEPGDREVVALYGLKDEQRRMVEQQLRTHPENLNALALANLEQLDENGTSIYSDSAKELIQAARAEAIAIMPLGAGGPGANLVVISSKGKKHLEGFFRKQNMPKLTDNSVREVMHGTGLLKGYMPFVIGKEPIQFSGFKELGLKEPTQPVKAQYSEATGKFSDVKSSPADSTEQKPKGFETMGAMSNIELPNRSFSEAMQVLSSPDLNVTRLLSVSELLKDIVPDYQEIASQEGVNQEAAKHNLQYTQDTVTTIDNIRLARRIQQLEETKPELLTPSALLIDKTKPYALQLEMAKRIGELDEIQKRLNCKIIEFDPKTDDINALLQSAGFSPDRAMAISSSDNLDKLKKANVRLMAIDGFAQTQYFDIASLAALSKCMVYMAIYKDHKDIGKIKNYASLIYRNLTGVPLTEDAIRDYMADFIISLSLPTPEVIYKEGELESLHRQALAVLIAA